MEAEREYIKKQAMIKIVISLEITVSQEWEKYNHMEILLLMVSSTTYKALCVDPANTFMTGEDKYPNNPTYIYNIMLHWKRT